jgi:hypothetical protein
MTESSTVAALRNKRDDIERAIAKYEKALTQARADLAHVNAAITIFEASGERLNLPPYVDVHRLLARGEAMTICKQALAKGPMNTRQLALYIMEAKGMDTTDRVLAKSVASRLIHALRQQWRRGKIERHAIERGVCIWGLPSVPA